MGQARSKLEDVKRELALLEAKGDTVQIIQKLSLLVRLALAQGNLEDALAKLDAILGIQLANSDHATKLETAQTMYFIGNTLRLLLLRGETEGRAELFARAESMLHKSLEIRLAHKDELNRLALVSKTRATLALLLQQQGHPLQARKMHEDALEGFGQLPLQSDAQMWAFSSKQQQWTSKAPDAVLASTSQRHLSASSSLNPPPRPASSIILNPIRNSRNSVSQILFPNSRSTHQLLLEAASQKANELPSSTTTRRRSETSPELYRANSLLFKGGAGLRASTAPLFPQPKPSWRLVLRSSSLAAGDQRRGGGGFRRFSGGNTPVATADSEGSLLRIIDLEPGKQISLGLGLPFATPATANPAAAGFGQIYIPLAPKSDRFGSFLEERHCTLHEEEVGGDGDEFGAQGEEDALRHQQQAQQQQPQQQQRWVITDTVRGKAGKKKGVIVNRVRISTSPLRVGDVIQIGNCGKIKLGQFAPNKQREEDFFGLEYEVQRIVSAVDSGDVNSLAPPKLFPGEDAAYQYFHVCCVAAQVNLNGQPLRDEYIREMFSTAVKSGIPYYQWDSFVFAELARARLLL